MAKIGLPKGSGKLLKVREKSVKSQGILKWILSGNPVYCTIIHYRLYTKNLWFVAISGLQLRVRNRKLVFLFLNQNIMLWVLKRTVSMRQFFRAPKT